jgi:hypothetical protein
VTEQQMMDRYGPVIDGSSKALWGEAAALVRNHFSKHKELASVVKDSPPYTTEKWKLKEEPVKLTLKLRNP